MLNPSFVLKVPARHLVVSSVSLACPDTSMQGAYHLNIHALWIKHLQSPIGKSPAYMWDYLIVFMDIKKIVNNLGEKYARGLTLLAWSS